MTSEPKREISYRLAPTAINSMPQQASPMGIGQSEFLRNQLRAASTVVWMTSPSTFELYPNSAEVVPDVEVVAAIQMEAEIDHFRRPPEAISGTR